MIAVVGSGIMGLAVAEFLSRTQPVMVISNEHPLAGSQAAAANLAIKAQLYARDPHFALKLQARKGYRAWLQALLDEARMPASPLPDHFCEGTGLEFFLSAEACAKQLARVTQPAAELAKQGLGSQPLKQMNDKTLCYFNEAWVDAAFCLKLLKQVLRQRGVAFLQENILHVGSTLEACKKHLGARQIVFCTGAWTQQVLTHFQLKTPKSMRLSSGSTLVKKASFEEVVTRFSWSEETIALCEFRDADKKVVLSGNKTELFFSSSSLRRETLDDAPAALGQANQNLEGLAFCYLNKSYPTTAVKTGFRVAFGHLELVVERLSADAVLCSGAHKSGFLFAPVVGELVNKQLIAL